VSVLNRFFHAIEIFDGEYHELPPAVLVQVFRFYLKHCFPQLTHNSSRVSNFISFQSSNKIVVANPRRHSRQLYTGLIPTPAAIDAHPLPKVSSDYPTLAGRAPIQELPMRVVHNVYFTLIDPSKPAVDKLLADCRKYLTGQPGILYFAVGELAADLDRPVNDRDWHVSLHLIFDTPEHQLAYQDDPTHHQFIDQNKSNWANVRVFDSLIHPELHQLPD
jgi:hypothetical protein